MKKNAIPHAVHETILSFTVAASATVLIGVGHTGGVFPVTQCQWWIFQCVKVRHSLSQQITMHVVQNLVPCIIGRF